MELRRFSVSDLSGQAAAERAEQASTKERATFQDLKAGAFCVEQALQTSALCETSFVSRRESERGHEQAGRNLDISFSCLEIREERVRCGSVHGCEKHGEAFTIMQAQAETGDRKPRTVPLFRRVPSLGFQSFRIWQEGWAEIKHGFRTHRHGAIFYDRNKMADQYRARQGKQ